MSIDFFLKKHNNKVIRTNHDVFINCDSLKKAKEFSICGTFTRSDSSKGLRVVRNDINFGVLFHLEKNRAHRNQKAVHSTKERKTLFWECKRLILGNELFQSMG